MTSGVSGEQDNNHGRCRVGKPESGLCFCILEYSFNVILNLYGILGVQAFVDMEKYNFIANGRSKSLKPGSSLNGKTTNMVDGSTQPGIACLSMPICIVWSMST